MAFLDDNGLLYLWGKIKSAISDATSGLSSAWADITGKPSWIGDSKPDYTASEVGAVPTSDKGVANGIASLDSSGKVPASQLPSYVDDVEEGYYNDGAYIAALTLHQHGIKTVVDAVSDNEKHKKDGTANLFQHWNWSSYRKNCPQTI